MRDLLQRPDLFSINTATLGYKTPLPAIIDACAARGIGAIAPWRRELQGEDLQQIAHQLAASNMSVSGLCRSTYYTAPTLAERKLAIDDNRRALDDAAVLNAACYMQVVGGLPTGTKDLYEAREQVKQGIRQLLPHSKDVGVPIALEPLHPMTAADRSCLCTLRQALDWCDELDPDGEFGLGVAVDVYHVWWDPDLASQILRAGNRIPADGRLLEAINLQVQEAALTGESLAVEKRVALLEDPGLPLGDRRNMVYAGTLATYGRGSAIIVATGMATEFGKIAQVLQGKGPLAILKRTDHDMHRRQDQEQRDKGDEGHQPQPCQR